MAAATSNGIDVSTYQGAQDWEALARGGMVYAFAKASEGQRTRDGHFAAHITGIIGAGLVPGAYHYAWPNQPAGSEAANYIAAVRPFARRGFVHALDLERRSDGVNYAGVNSAEIRAYATAWVKAVKAAFPGQRVGVYTSGADLDAGHYPANSDFLWYPAYPSSGMSYAQAAARARPAPSGRQPLFWQFTSTPVDRNIAYLAPAALRAWAAGTTQTVQEDDVELTDAQIDKIATAVRNKILNESTDDPSIADNPKAPTADDKSLKAIVWGIGRDAAHASAKGDAILAALPKLAEAAGADPAAFSAEVAEDLAERLKD